MSHFYGYIQGNRGEVTRCGTKSSGISALIKSWEHDVRVRLQAGENGEDVLVLKVPTDLKVIYNGKELDKEE